MHTSTGSIGPKSIKNRLAYTKLMSHVACPLCGCCSILGRFPLQGPVHDIELVEFEGLGKGKGFRVKSRRSALDDEGLRGAIQARAHGILSLLEPDQVDVRQERDIEVLTTDLSETEGRLRSLSSGVSGLIDARGPIFDLTEYIAVDNAAFREAYQKARDAMDNVRSL